jgi:hypothetical protein
MLIFFKYIIPVTFLTFFISSCEDPLPSDYIPETVVEAVLIVDKPIENIIVMRSQPLNKPFDYNASLIDDAEVIIRTEGKEYNLVFRSNNNPGYYFPDTTEKVKSETTYTLEIKLKDGSLITGKTTTQKKTNWIYTPGTVIYYPKDTLKLAPVDSLRIEYAPVDNNMFYILSVVCRDTLDYGKYLTPATDEKNRRIIRPGMKIMKHFFTIYRHGLFCLQQKLRLSGLYLSGWKAYCKYLRSRPKLFELVFTARILRELRPASFKC